MSGVQIGVMLPTFTADPRLPVRAGAAAEAGGLDGVFAFDHLWPLGNPGRPALWSFAVLGAVSAATDRVCVGPLVARVGLLMDADLLGAVGALTCIAGRGRVVVALGAGDRLSAPENGAYGVPFGPSSERTGRLTRVAGALLAHGVTTWIGGTSTAVSDAAGSIGATRNLWGATVEEVAAARATTPVTWAGPVLVGRNRVDIGRLRDRFADRPGLISGTVEEVAAHLAALHAAGAGWCVCTPLDYITRPLEAVKTVCLVRAAVP